MGRIAKKISGDDGMVFIRADANETIASGHMMRCMTIARELIHMNEEVEFLLSDESSVSLLKKDFKYQILNTYWESPDTKAEIDLLKEILIDCRERKNTLPVLLVDSYYVDNRYFTKLRPFAKLVFIDDLFEDIYDVDVLINYTVTHELFNYKQKYAKSHTRLLLGTQYAPLREQFLISRQNLNIGKRKPQGKLQVLFMCGGSDPFDFLSHFLSRAIQDQYFGDYDYHVISGAYNPHWEKIQKLSQEHENIYFYRNVENMAEKMEKCDIAVSAAGTTLYECCAIGLPTIFFCMADNQEYDIDIFSRDGKMIYAGDIRSEKETVIQQILLQLHSLKCSEIHRKTMSQKVWSIVDGYGARRIANALKRLLEIGNFFEPAMEDVTLKIGTKNDFDFYYSLKCERSDKYWMGFRENPVRQSLYECFITRISDEQNKEGGGTKLIKMISRLGENTGYVQFTFNETSIELGISIAERFQRLGIGTKAIGCAVEFLERIGEKREIFARIREDNAASLKCFAKNGFIETNEYELVFYPYIERKIKRIRYIKRKQ